MKRITTVLIAVALVIAMSAGPVSATPPICSWVVPTFDVVGAASEVGTVAIGLSSTPARVAVPTIVHRALTSVQEFVQLVDARLEVCID